MNLEQFFRSLFNKKKKVEETVMEKLPGNPDNQQEQTGVK